MEICIRYMEWQILVMVKMNREILEKLLQFRQDRNWLQFHTLKNLACAISIEAAELLESFQWQDEPKNLITVRYEIADILIYILYLTHDLNLDIEEIIKEKIAINSMKYPVEKARGNANKYTEL